MDVPAGRTAAREPPEGGNPNQPVLDARPSYRSTPRPERPTVYDDLDGKVENFRSRMQVMPGLTGYAQVNGGYDLNPAEKLKYDLIYINHCSVLFDLWCLLKTIPVVFTMKGAR